VVIVFNNYLNKTGFNFSFFVKVAALKQKNIKILTTHYKHISQFISVVACHKCNSSLIGCVQATRRAVIGGVSV